MTRIYSSRDSFTPRQLHRWQDDTYVRTMRSPRAWVGAVLAVGLLPVFVVGVVVFLECVR